MGHKVWGRMCRLSGAGAQRWSPLVRGPCAARLRRRAPYFHIFVTSGGLRGHPSVPLPVRSLADLKGKRVFSFPTGGRFMSRFGVIPVSLPWEDIQVALQTGELDGVCWSGITEDYTAGWADVCKYYLTNNINGGWIGSYFANSEKWNALPEHLKVLFRLTCDSSHYYRQHWYWWGEAHYRVTGGKMQLTSIPDAEWKQVETEAHKFWDEVAARSPRCARVVEILKQYNAEMEKAGRPYRY